MSAFAWFKMFPADFLGGVEELTCEERGAYITVLLLIYQEGRPVADNAKWLAAKCLLSTYAWRKVRERLVTLGKLTVSDGRISNPRADREMEKRAACCEASKESGRRGGRAKRAGAADPLRREDDDLWPPKPSQDSARAETSDFQQPSANDINDIRKADPLHAQEAEKPPVDPDPEAEIPEKYEKNIEILTPVFGQKQSLSESRDSEVEDKGDSTCASSPVSTNKHLSPVEGGARAKTAHAISPSDVQAVFVFWNETAISSGLIKARVLDDKRRGMISGRLRELGLDDVREAIRKMGASSFCRGTNGRTWVADIVFAMRPANCLKALEGGYDDRPVRPKFRPGSNAEAAYDWGLSPLPYPHLTPDPDDADRHDGPTIDASYDLVPA